MFLRPEQHKSNVLLLALLPMNYRGETTNMVPPLRKVEPIGRTEQKRVSDRDFVPLSKNGRQP